MFLATDAVGLAGRAATKVAGQDPSQVTAMGERKPTELDDLNKMLDFILQCDPKVTTRMRSTVGPYGSIPLGRFRHLFRQPLRYALWETSYCFLQAVFLQPCTSKSSARKHPRGMKFHPRHARRGQHDGQLRILLQWLGCRVISQAVFRRHAQI